MAELVFDALRTVVRTRYGNSDDSAEFIRQFRDAIRDSGLEQNLNDWRDCYYNKRLPKEMTASTASIQLKNFEREILKIRTEGFCAGYSRKERTLNAFDIKTNRRGHTVLVPTTHLSKIILQNTYDENYKLPPVPDYAYEESRQEINELKTKITQLQNKITDYEKQIRSNEDYRLEKMAVESVLESQKKITKRIQDQRDEAHCIIQGLCSRFGLMCSIDTRGITYTSEDKKGRRKGRKNRRTPILEYTFGDFDRPVEDEFIKDLTTEGVEPNPGPDISIIACIAVTLALLTVFDVYVDWVYENFDNPDIITANVIKSLAAMIVCFFLTPEFAALAGLPNCWRYTLN